MRTIINKGVFIVKSKLIISLCLALLLLSACSQKEQSALKQEPKNEPYLTMTDEVGNKIVLQEKPQKVFAPAMEDHILAAGVTPIAQWSNGVKPQTYLQEQLQGVPEISFASGPPAAETIMDLAPDLIILHSEHFMEDGTYENYAKIAPTFVFKHAAQDIDNTITTLGKLFDTEKTAQQAINEYDTKVTQAKEQLADFTQDKKVALIRFNQKGMFFLTDDYFSGHVLVHELGFTQSDIVTNGAFEVSLEILPTLDADYIFLLNDGNLGDEYVKELKESSVWQLNPTVQANHVFETTSDYWLNGGVHAQSNVIQDVLGFFEHVEK